MGVLENAQSFIVWDGFEIKNANDPSGIRNGIYNGINTANNTFKNLIIHNTQSSGIAAYGNNVIIDNCEVYNTCLGGLNEGISLFGCNTFEIKNTKLHDVPKNGIDCKNGSSNGLIHNNEIYNTSTGIYLDANGTAQDNFKIYNNRIHNNSVVGIVLGSEVSPYPAVTNVDIYNNLIYNNYQGFIIWANPFNRNFRIINNTFYRNGLNEIVSYGKGAQSGTNQNCIIRNNILYGSDSSRFIYYDDPVSSGICTTDHNLCYDSNGNYSYFLAGSRGTDLILNNPLLNNPDALDFSIPFSSPAVDAGSATSAPAMDYAGNPRPSRSDYDIGAYEYQDQPPVISPIGNKFVSENSTLSFAVSANDTEGDSLTYSASNLPFGAAFDTGTHSFTWTPTHSQTGIYPGVQFEVSDGFHTSIQSISITVARIFTLGSIGSQTVDENARLIFSVVSANATAVTANVSTLPPGAIFVDGTFSWTPTYDQAGIYPGVHFETDNGDVISGEDITITVNNIDRPPVFNPIGNHTVSENSTLSFTISAADPDNDSLTYSASHLPSGATFDNPTHTFSWTPTFNQAGVYPNIYFVVSDGSLTDSEDITITVTNVNLPPVLASIGDKTINEGSNLTFSISATDPDNDSLTYSASHLPSGATFDITIHKFSWTPSYSQNGTYPNIHFVVSDGTLTDSEDITITVNDIANSGGNSGGGGGGGVNVPTPTPTPTPSLTDSQGKFGSTVTIASADGTGEVIIEKGTVGQTAGGNPVSTISIALAGSPAAAPDQTVIIGSVYNFGPEGTSFSTPVSITLKYDPAKLPEGINEKYLVIAYWSAAENRWVELKSSVNTVSHTVTAETDHFRTMPSWLIPARPNSRLVI